MLNQLMAGNGMLSAKPFPFGFSDRSDPWAGVDAAEARPDLGRMDFSAIAEGLVADTLIATEHGWSPVQDLRPGDRIVTFDNGLQPLRALRTATLWTAEDKAPTRSWPLTIPARALGNRTEMQLMPSQSILIEADDAETLYGDPFMLVPAASLDGHKGITRQPPQREMALYSLEFDAEEVVYANGTVLLHCRGQNAGQVDAKPGTLTAGQNAPYRHLTEDQALALVSRMGTAA